MRHKPRVRPPKAWLCRSHTGACRLEPCSSGPIGALAGSAIVS
jgi:hypothetical protein